MAFLNLEKAFDSIPLAEIWTSMNNRKIDKDIIKAIQGLYENNLAYVIKNNERTDIFEIGEGLRQGAVLSLLFITVIDDIIRTLHDDTNVSLVTINFSLYTYRWQHSQMTSCSVQIVKEDCDKCRLIGANNLINEN